MKKIQRALIYIILLQLTILGFVISALSWKYFVIGYYNIEKDPNLIVGVVTLLGVAFGGLISVASVGVIHWLHQDSVIGDKKCK